jgi:ATP-dependent RNA helicase RhlE
VHRIGRTARAGADGSAIAFCTPEDRGLLRDIEKTIRAQVPVKEHELGLKGVSQLAPTFGWNPAGKDKPQGAKPHHRGQKPNRNHGSGNGQGKPQGAKPQGSAPKRDSKPNAGGAQAPKRTGGGSWMTQLGNRQG